VTFFGCYPVTGYGSLAATGSVPWGLFSEASVMFWFPSDFAAKVEAEAINGNSGKPKKRLQVLCLESQM